LNIRLTTWPLLLVTSICLVRQKTLW
jgi:hypothetical protein